MRTRGMSCDILTYLLSVSLVCTGISVLGFLLLWFTRATFVQDFIHTQLTNPVSCGPGVCLVIFWPTSSLCLLSALASLSLDFFSSALPELPLFSTLFTHSSLSTYIKRKIMIFPTNPKFFGKIGLSKKCKPRSDGSFRSLLIWV